MTEVVFEGEFIQTYKVASYRYYVTSVVPHKSAHLVILLYDKEGIDIHRIEKDLVEEEYEAWGLDDKYLDDIVEAEVKKVIVPSLELVWEAEPEPEVIEE